MVFPESLVSENEKKLRATAFDYKDFNDCPPTEYRDLIHCT
jgi:hypothetical protein